MKNCTSLVFLLGLLFLVGCSTGKSRVAQSDMTQTWETTRADTFDRLMQSSKSGSIYLDWGTVLIVDAVYKDLHYRAGYLTELSDVYLYPSQRRLEIWQQSEEDYQNFYEFLLVIYAGGTKPPEFGRPSSRWQVYLYDDEGDMLRASKVSVLSPKDHEYIFLKKYLKEVDRWAQVYRVRFPKLDRLAPRGSNSFSLLVTGIEGKTRLEWQDAGLFYQRPGEIPAP